MAGPNDIDMGGDTLHVNQIFTGATGPGAPGSLLSLSGGTLPAGTASTAPITFTSGTNLTSPVAGALEFDGKVFYETAVNGARQAVDTVQFAIVGSTPTPLGNDNAVHAVFAAANDVLQLAAATTYQFEAYYSLTTGATTHTTAVAFAASSAFTAINYWAELWSITSGTVSTTAPSVVDVAQSTAKVLNATSTATTTIIRCRGIIQTNAASTVTPQIQFSADPTGTNQANTNSYFRIWPQGTNTVTSVGNWS